MIIVITDQQGELPIEEVCSTVKESFAARGDWGLKPRHQKETSELR